jgi:transposase InsO family protein
MLLHPIVMMVASMCREHGIEHRLTKPHHPWTNGQVERMNRTLKEATVRRYHYKTHRQLTAFPDAYNFVKWLKILSGLMPYEHICKVWADQPGRFRYDPTHLTSGPNT